MDDIEAIKQLKARYFRTMDTKDWAGMRQVFTDDVVMDTTDSGGGVVNGADAFVAFLQETLAGAVTVHHGHMPEVRLTSQPRPRASGRCTMPSSGLTAPGCRATATTTRPTSGWTGVADRHLHPDPAAAGPDRTGLTRSAS